MRSLPAILTALVLAINGYGQSSFAIEQYSYVGISPASVISPIAHYQSKTNWYAEARYNYEDLQTFSLWAGRTFAKEQAFSYSFTPMLGGMTGKLKGGALGMNMEMDYKRFNFSSQSQYAMLPGNRTSNFFFSWSEISYRPFSWLYGGFSIQHTKVYNCNARLEPGVLIGFNYKQWSVPVYGFNPYSGSRYFIIGVGWEWKQKNPTAVKKIDPSLLTNKD